MATIRQRLASGADDLTVDERVAALICDGVTALLDLGPIEPEEFLTIATRVAGLVTDSVSPSDSAAARIPTVYEQTISTPRERDDALGMTITRKIDRPWG